jgi:hypothetical protein
MKDYYEDHDDEKEKDYMIITKMILTRKKMTIMRMNDNCEEHEYDEN